MPSFTVQQVLSLKPPHEYNEDRLNQLWGENETLTIEQIMYLPVSLHDLTWFVQRSGLLLCQNKWLWLADCAEHVMSAFEIKYPLDTRPRDAITALRSFINQQISFAELQIITHDANHSAETARCDEHCAFLDAKEDSNNGDFEAAAAHLADAALFHKAKHAANSIVNAASYAMAAFVNQKCANDPHASGADPAESVTLAAIGSVSDPETENLWQRAKLLEYI